MRNQIVNLYYGVLAQIAATRDTLVERMQSVHETASILSVCNFQSMKSAVELNSLL